MGNDLANHFKDFIAYLLALLGTILSYCFNAKKNHTRHENDDENEDII